MRVLFIRAHSRTASFRRLLANEYRVWRDDSAVVVFVVMTRAPFNTRESPFAVTEQLGLQKLLWYGGAIDGDKRSVTARAGLMDGKRAYPRPAVANSILSLARLRCDSRQSLRLSTFSEDLAENISASPTSLLLLPGRVPFVAIAPANVLETCCQAGSAREQRPARMD
jgi:hypothetical protein